MANDLETIIAMENRDDAQAPGPTAIAAELSKYQMPQAEFGLPVTWYRFKNRRDPALAFVCRVWEDAIDVVIAADPSMSTGAGDIKLHVRHISDPRLALGRDHMEDGCWEYTDYHRSQTRMRHELETRIAKLESAANKPKGKPD